MAYHMSYLAHYNNFTAMTSQSLYHNPPTCEVTLKLKNLDAFTHWVKESPGTLTDRDLKDLVTWKDRLIKDHQAGVAPEDQLKSSENEIQLVLVVIPSHANGRYNGLVPRYGRPSNDLFIQQSLPVKKHQENSRDFINNLEQLIQSHLSDSRFNIQSMAKKMFLSRTQLFRRIKDGTGLSPQTLLMRARLNKAANMISSSSSTLQEIADAVGFANTSHFCRSFKKHFNQTPGAFRLTN